MHTDSWSQSQLLKIMTHTLVLNDHLIVFVVWFGVCNLVIREWTIEQWDCDDWTIGRLSVVIYVHISSAMGSQINNRYSYWLLIR